MVAWCGPRGGGDPLAGETVVRQVQALAAGVAVRDVLAGVEPIGGEHSWPIDEVELLAPVAAPGAIYGIGLNYASHAAETGAEPPPQPIVFTKVPGSVAPPGGPIRCPEVVRLLDYEGELVIVIGAGGKIGGYS